MNFTITFQDISFEDVITLVGMKYIKSFNNNSEEEDKIVSEEEDEIDMEINIQDEKDKLIKDIRGNFSRTFKEINQEYKNVEVRRRKLKDLSKKMNSEIDKIRLRNTLPKKKKEKQKKEKKQKKTIDVDKYIKRCKTIKENIIIKRSSAIRIAEQENRVTKESKNLMKDVDTLQRKLLDIKRLLSENGVDIRTIDEKVEEEENSTEEEESSTEDDENYGSIL